MVPDKAARLFRVPFSGISRNESDFQVKNVNEIPNKIIWETQQMCSMPKGLPWNLQRVKWNKFVRDSTTEENVRSVENNSGELEAETLAWMFSMDMNKMKSIFDNELFSNCSEDSTVISMGALCLSTRMARALTQTYDSSGMLESVALMDGILQ